MRLSPAVAVCLAFASTVGALPAADLFPLQSGNSWTYRHRATGSAFTVSVGDSVTLNGRVYFWLTGFVDKRVLARANDAGQLVQFDQDSGQESVLTDFNSSGDAWWDAAARGCGQQGQTPSARGSHDGPVGPLAGVLEIRFRIRTCADTGVDSEQYATNIGMLRRVTQSIAGPRQYDLIYARVGHAVLDAFPRATFSVSVEDDPAQPNLKVTLRIETRPGFPVTLPFSSGQMYDLVTRDTGGTEIWRWSADKAFTMALHELEVDGVWSDSVAVPRPPLGLDFRPTGYTLEAWMTTMGGTPRFAATYPLIVTASGMARERQNGRGGRTSRSGPRQ